MVVLYHIKFMEVGPQMLRRLIPSFGHEFVIVFFVLSGYVIAATVDRKRHHALTDYALDRAARIYSVALPTLLLSTLVSLLLWAAGMPGSGALQDIVWAAGLNLLFLAQSWSLNAFPSCNPPFWSLSYEVMYYVLYGCLHFLRGRKRVFWCCMVALVAGPRVLLLLPCWLIGVAAYRWRDLLKFDRAIGWSLLVSPALVMGLLSYLRFGSAMREALQSLFGSHYNSLAWSTEFPKDYIGAIFVALHLYAVRQLNLALPGWLEKVSVRAATLTFTLYLLHFPAIMLTRDAFGSASQTLACFVAALVFTAATTYLVGSYSEARRWQFRAWLAGRFAPWPKA